MIFTDVAKWEKSSLTLGRRFSSSGRSRESKGSVPSLLLSDLQGEASFVLALAPFSGGSSVSCFLLMVLIALTDLVHVGDVFAVSLVVSSHCLVSVVETEDEAFCASFIGLVGVGELEDEAVSVLRSLFGLFVPD